MKFHQPKVTPFVMVEMKCKPSLPLPNPAASTEQPRTRAGGRLHWGKMIPSENPWTDPTDSCQQRHEHSVGKAFPPFCRTESGGPEHGEARSQEPRSCLPARGRQLSPAAERGRLHPHSNEHPLLLLPTGSLPALGKAAGSKIPALSGESGSQTPGAF